MAMFVWCGAATAPVLQPPMTGTSLMAAPASPHCCTHSPLPGGKAFTVLSSMLFMNE